MSFMSKNVNNSHRISIKSNWKTTRTEDPNDLNILAIHSRRVFHLPTGISTEQNVNFHFGPVADGLQLSLNDIPQPLTIIEGLASARFTGMMQSINRVEICWRVERLMGLYLLEHFVAWLEISDGLPSSAV